MAKARDRTPPNDKLDEYRRSATSSAAESRAARPNQAPARISSSSCRNTRLAICTTTFVWSSMASSRAGPCRRDRVWIPVNGRLPCTSRTIRSNTLRSRGSSPQGSTAAERSWCGIAGRGNRSVIHTRGTRTAISSSDSTARSFGGRGSWFGCRMANGTGFSSRRRTSSPVPSARTTSSRRSRAAR